MADEELIRAGLEALESLIGMLIEDAHDGAIGMAPDDPAKHLDHIRMLQQVGTDVVALAGACEVLLRWQSEAKKAPS